MAHPSGDFEIWTSAAMMLWCGSTTEDGWLQKTVKRLFGCIASLEKLTVTSHAFEVMPPYASHDKRSKYSRFKGVLLDSSRVFDRSLSMAVFHFAPHIIFYSNNVQLSVRFCYGKTLGKNVY